MNLLNETIEAIENSGRTVGDIVFIGSEDSGYSCTLEEFVLLADKDYDDGFGAQQVASDLIIVFKDGFKMERHEYDGSEGWDYSKPFRMPPDFISISSLFCVGDQVGWRSLREIHEDD